MKVGKEHNNGRHYKHKNQWGLGTNEPMEGGSLHDYTNHAQPPQMLALFTTPLQQHKMEGAEDARTKGNQRKEEKFGGTLSCA
ncbi:hypothetical protein VIGAN_03207700 [Vigna angularis var. angularis]|uniref:Uncharacterized protein n=1 Tax=Vigna angularis var. angularis TaxID=157739 RepID=A0A0S3RND2_PHAAN|nr:hypothetical protein VIGAN_03207700 [Vigna angularis var. angularis]